MMWKGVVLLIFFRKQLKKVIDKLKKMIYLITHSRKRLVCVKRKDFELLCQPVRDHKHKQVGSFQLRAINNERNS